RADRQAGAIGRRQRLRVGEDFAPPGSQRRLAPGAPLNTGYAVWHAYHVDALAQVRPACHLMVEVAPHGLGRGVDVHAALTQPAPPLDLFRVPPIHLPRRAPEFDDNRTVAVVAQGDDRGFLQDDAPPLVVNQDVDRPQVNGNT